MGSYIEEILSLRLGRKVVPGEDAVVPCDWIVAHDGTMNYIMKAVETSGRSIPTDVIPRIRIFRDHSSPPLNEDFEKIHSNMGEFCAEKGIRIYQSGDGISHSVMVDEGIVEPGQFYASADSHGTAVGAIPGAIGFGFGGEKMAAAFLTGKMLFTVPKSILVRFRGEYPAGTDTLDGGFYMLRQLQTVVDEVRESLEGEMYLPSIGLEFYGEPVSSHTSLEMMPYTTLAKETNADTAVRVPSGKGVDLDDYSAVVDIDLSELQPQVVVPPQRRKTKVAFEVRDVEEVEGQVIDKIYVQSCTGAYDYTFAAVARILGGRRIQQEVKMLAIPATRMIEERLMKKGYLETLRQAGVSVCGAGCGACIGRQYLTQDNSNIISTSSRNGRGRMGGDSFVYLTSGLTAAATALNGKITDPRRLI